MSGIKINAVVEISKEVDELLCSVSAEAASGLAISPASKADSLSVFFMQAKPR